MRGFFMDSPATANWATLLPRSVQRQNFGQRKSTITLVIENKKQI
jgi:hypothetical protein